MSVIATRCIKNTINYWANRASLSSRDSVAAPESSLIGQQRPAMWHRGNSTFLDQEPDCLKSTSGFLLSTILNILEEVSLLGKPFCSSPTCKVLEVALNQRFVRSALQNHLLQMFVTQSGIIYPSYRFTMQMIEGSEGPCSKQTMFNPAFE